VGAGVPCRGSKRNEAVPQGFGKLGVLPDCCPIPRGTSVDFPNAYCLQLLQIANLFQITSGCFYKCYSSWIVALTSGGKLKFTIYQVSIYSHNSKDQCAFYFEAFVLEKNVSCNNGLKL